MHCHKSKWNCSTCGSMCVHVCVCERGRGGARLSAANFKSKMFIENSLHKSNRNLPTFDIVPKAKQTGGSQGAWQRWADKKFTHIQWQPWQWPSTVVVKVRIEVAAPEKLSTAWSVCPNLQWALKARHQLDLTLISRVNICTACWLALTSELQTVGTSM